MKRKADEEAFEGPSKRQLIDSGPEISTGKSDRLISVVSLNSLLTSLQPRRAPLTLAATMPQASRPQPKLRPHQLL